MREQEVFYSWPGERIEAYLTRIHNIDDDVAIPLNTPDLLVVYYGDGRGGFGSVKGELA